MRVRIWDCYWTCDHCKTKVAAGAGASILRKAEAPPIGRHARARIPVISVIVWCYLTMNQVMRELLLQLAGSARTPAESEDCGEMVASALNVLKDVSLACRKPTPAVNFTIKSPSLATAHCHVVW